MVPNECSDHHGQIDDLQMIYVSYYCCGTNNKFETWDGGQEVSSSLKGDIKTPEFFAVYGCANPIKSGKNESYFRLLKVMTHKGKKSKKLTEKKQQTWIKASV